MQTVSAGSSSGTAEYDAMGNLLSFSQSVSGLSDGSVMSNSYTYENDKIKTISHNGFTYEFEYDVWGNQTKAKIGNLVLTENTYGTDENSDRLSSTVFANGQSVSYAYDENDNITSVFYDGEVTPRYSYTYDEEGVLLLSEDNKAGLQTFYTEDGTEIRKISDNTLVFSSTCDEDGKETHNIAGNSITYVYDGEYNSVTGVYTDSVSFEKTGSISNENGTAKFSTDAEILTNTDWFGRVTSKSLSVDIETDNGDLSVDSGILLGYADTDTTATTKVTSLTSFVSTAAGATLNQEYYEYDAVGNITGIYRIEDEEKVYYNKYYYDEANQIIREDNRLGKFTSTYTYDVGGNIVSRKRYSYTEGDISGLNAREVHTYSYEHTLWGDVLTGYNGQPVTYDAMGNITSLEGDTYEWTAGRQLSRIIKGDSGIRIDYFYDDNGQLSRFDMYNEDGTKSGTYQYFWEDTTLIALRLLEYTVDSNNVENEIEIAQLRILYDADGEALGFLVNDLMPLLYTKNILGDITGVINPENGRLLFGYAYDAYGNYKLVTENNTVGENIAAVFLQLLNPLTYRGYAFSIAVGASHYLGSRFYSLQLCRFMNADAYADTAQGVVGTNMFAYCNNNPVMFIDPEGTDAETHQPLGIPEYIVAFIHLFKNFAIIFGVSSGVIISLALINEFSAYVDEYINTLFVNLTTYISSSLSTLEDDLQKVMDTLIEKLKKLKKKPNYSSKTEKHHICAKVAQKAIAAKLALKEVGLNVNHEFNLIDLYTIVHKRIHTYAYYSITNTIVVSAYDLGLTDQAKKENVILALFILYDFLYMINKTVGEMFPDLVK